MATCKDIYSFLGQVSSKNVTVTLAGTDENLLQQLQIAQFLTSDQYRQLAAEVATLASQRTALAEEGADQARLAATLQAEAHRTHSILFHLEGKEKQQAAYQQESQTQAEMRSVQSDLTQKQQAFAQLVAKQSLLDTLVPYGDRYVGLSGLGLMASRDLGVRLYRVSDLDFATYWQQAQHITQELNDLASHGSEYVLSLSGGLPGADRSYLWATAIGLAKEQPNAGQGIPLFGQIYNALYKITNNAENRLMSSEILFAMGAGRLGENVPALSDLVRQVRKTGVPAESALGVASVLLLGRREDGTYATQNLAQFLRVTRSYESAALLAIVNAPFNDLNAKFASLRAMFGSWGYQPSEDVELSSAYLTVSELPVEGIGTKLAILAKGMGTYLQYPLVASSILASVGALEANETLNLLEEAYEIVGRRAMPMSQPELICLGVRMVHEVRDELVGKLDTTATAQPTAAVRGYYGYGPGFFFLPVIVAHGVYYSTYSGIGGAHPGHVHAMAGGGFVG